MLVVSSQLFKEVPQADGRVWVLERHEMASGEVAEFYYLAAADADPEEIMRERAMALGEG